MELITALLSDAQFRLATLALSNIVDLAIVTLIIFIFLRMIRRSNASFLLRGLLTLIIILLISNLFIPLPTVDALLLGMIFVLLIATPITLQPELRRWLERIGRPRLLSLRGRQTLAATVAQPLRSVIEQMAQARTGALIVLEGADVLDEIAISGIRVDALLSEELMLTLFHNKTPLHDGAVILRNDKILAASCVLPLTNTALPDNRRYGTRHRAAVGLSEACDALIIVVSEETGHISLVQYGKLKHLHAGIDLQKNIIDFYTNGKQKDAQKKQGGFGRNDLSNLLRNLSSNLIYLAFAALIAVLAWAAVTNQINPIENTIIRSVPLRVDNLPDGLVVLGSPTQTVDVEVKTTADVMETISANSFQASVSLADVSAGLNRLTVNLESTAGPVQIGAIQPSALDIELVPIVSKEVPVVVRAMGATELSAIYELRGVASATTQSVTVTGPQSVVETVQFVRADLNVASATSTLVQSVNVQPINLDEEAVSGLTVVPDQVVVRQQVQRRLDLRVVGVRAVTVGTAPDGYWLSSISVDPSVITLQSDPELLDAHSNFVNTLPIDLTALYGNSLQEVPLDLPDGFDAYDSNGNRLAVVAVNLEMSALQGNVVVIRPIQFSSLPEEQTLDVEITEIEILLSGPLPILRTIEEDPELIQVLADLSATETNVPVEITPTIILPEGISYQLVNVPIVLTIIEPEPSQN